MTFHHVAGSPVFTPNKIPFIINFQSKWSAEALESLKKSCEPEAHKQGEFDKLDNPLLNGLKKFAKNELVLCKKCEAMVRVVTNGAIKSTFQFDCKQGIHHLSATQILGTLPDEWISSVTELMSDSNRIQTLKWLDKGHLSEEIWEIKGLKNAKKRFSVELSPTKPDSFKIRAVNNSLEMELQELKTTVEKLGKRQDFIESENLSLRQQLKASKEEVAMLRRLLSEEPKNCEPKVNSFAEVTAIHRPRPAKITTRKHTPLETISKSVPSRQSPEGRPAYSPLKIIFFEGCHRKSPAAYRSMFKDIGVDTRAVRDITFLTDDIMQLTTYESAVEHIASALRGISENVRRLESFDPTKAASYTKYGDFSDKDVKASYFAVIAKSAERLSKTASNVKALKRSSNFLNKVVESQNFDFKSQEIKAKVFFLGNLLDYAKSIGTPKESKDVEMDSDILVSSSQAEITIQ